MERPIPKPNEVYRHFKGKLYLIITIVIITIAKHSETMVAQFLYNGFNFKICLKPTHVADCRITLK